MQDREPDEFRESTSFFQIWLLFRQNRVALFCFYLFCLLILTALFPKLIMPYSENSRPFQRHLPYWRSRVVPAVSLTMARRLLVRRLKSVDLPTFGRPTIATKFAMMSV